MTEVSAFFVQRVVSVAPPSADRDALYAVAGVTADGLAAAGTADAHAKVPIDRYFDLLEAAAEYERPAIGVHMRTSASMKCEDFGAVGLAFKSAPTLWGSFERMDRYSKLFNDKASFGLVDQGREVMWTHRRNDTGREGLYLSNEAALGTFLSLCRDAQGVEVTPARVQFAHERVGDGVAAREHFQCPVEFEAPVDAIVFEREIFDRPNEKGDPGIWRFFADHLEDLFPLHEKEAWDREVMVMVADMLGDGVPPLGEVARAMGLGSRTLQRRLSAMGKTYHSLVDDVRRQCALKLIAEGRYSFAEVAFLTGFSEQSSFTRAFKRWSGTTPRAFRHASEGPGRLLGS